MNDEQKNKMVVETYDEAKDDTLRSMISEFYSMKMLSIVIFVWATGLIYIALAIFSGIRFLKTDQVKFQIMYAVIFICCVQFVVLLKIFSWQIIHKNSIKKEIKRLELRIAK